MDWVYAAAAFLMIVGVAIFLGRLDHVRHPVAYTLGWLGCVLLLLLIGSWDRHPLIIGALVLAMLLRSLEHIPVWLIYTVLALGVGLAFRYILILIAQSLAELGAETEKTYARIALMESSLREKLDDIASRLPPRTEDGE